MGHAAVKLMSEEATLKVFEDLKGILDGYNIAWVSEDSGVSKPTLYFWLDGTTHKPRLDTIVKVANTLGYEITLTKQAGRRPRFRRPRLRSVK